MLMIPNNLGNFGVVRGPFELVRIYAVLSRDWRFEMGRWGMRTIFRIFGEIAANVLAIPLARFFRHNRS